VEAEIQAEKQQKTYLLTHKARVHDMEMKVEQKATILEGETSALEALLTTLKDQNK